MTTPSENEFGGCHYYCQGIKAQGLSSQVIIPMGIIDRVMNNRYAGDGSVHPSEHLLYIKELCELFTIAGVSSEVIMRKIFSLSLKDKARDWYVLLEIGRASCRERVYVLV